jgi:uncharacterized protein (TIGR03492 family)
MKDLLVVSNGYGEDDIACKIVDALRAETASTLTIEGWPMVGEGMAYRARAIPIVGTPNTLPNAGFATTMSWPYLLQDLRAGWISTYWRQLRAAHAMRSQYRMALAVGDIVPIAASVLARARFLFVGCAKSSYYRTIGRYTRLERGLLRQFCELTFPRDALSLEELSRARVPTRYVGNSMMDGLEGTGDRFGIPNDMRVVAMLAGTRRDAEQNLLDLAAAITRVGEIAETPAAFRFVFAVGQALDPHVIRRRLETGARTREWSVTCEGVTTGVVLRAVSSQGVEMLLVKSQFADVLRLATIVVGMAGTANEQAVGLGLPLINVPSAGIQGEAYVAMKMQYFGDAAIAVNRDPDKIASAINDLMSDPERRARMAQAGRARMGEPGASRAIAREVLARLAQA